MKNFLLTVIAFISFQFVYAQETNELLDDKPYNLSGIDVKPEFPGGITEFYKFIGKNYIVPDVKGLVGKVYVAFIIEKDGSINEVKIVRDLGFGTGEEAIRVLKICPKWIPGEQNGKYVRVSSSLIFPGLPIIEMIGEFVAKSATLGRSPTLRNFRRNLSAEP